MRLGLYVFYAFPYWQLLKEIVYPLPQLYIAYIDCI
jgi:hypothetical protein